MGWYAQLFEAVTREPGATPHSTHQGVKFNALLLPLVLHDDGLGRPGFFTAQGFVAGQHVDAIGLEGLARQIRHLLVFADHDAWCHLYLGYVSTQPRKGLRQLAADRASPQHHHALGHLVEFGEFVPQGVAGHVAHRIQARQRWHKRARASGDHDIASGERPCATVVQGDLHRPRVHNSGVAHQNLHTQAGVALDAVVRRDLGNDGMDTRHDLAKTEARAGSGQAVFRRMQDLMAQLGGLDECLAGHAAEVQAVATHLVGLDQGYFGLDCGGYERADQTTGPGTNDHQVALKTLWANCLPACVDLALTHRIQHPLGNQREQAQQDESTYQARRQNGSQRIDLGNFGAGIHVGHGAGQHAELADPEEGPGLDARQAHQQIERKKWNGGYQPQGKQVKRTFLVDTFVDLRQPLAKALFN